MARWRGPPGRITKPLRYQYLETRRPVQSSRHLSVADKLPPRLLVAATLRSSITVMTARLYRQSPSLLGDPTLAGTTAQCLALTSHGLTLHKSIADDVFHFAAYWPSRWAAATPHHLRPFLRPSIHSSDHQAPHSIFLTSPSELY